MAFPGLGERSATSSAPGFEDDENRVSLYPANAMLETLHESLSEEIECEKVQHKRAKDEVSEGPAGRRCVEPLERSGGLSIKRRRTARVSSC